MNNSFQDNLAVGKTIGGGRYILNKRLGQETQVWLAHDEIENKPVVMRFIAPGLYQDPQALEELRQRVLNAYELSHQNIGKIYELYESEGMEPFISSEHIEGMSLPALQRMQPQKVCSWTYLVPFLKQACDALQYCHSQSVIQGSLKPSNLMVDNTGSIKLLDPGIAGMLSNPMYGGQASLLPYLSPQQVDGNPPEVTDDIYSLGICLFELLTSTVPFYKGDILPQIRNTQPDPIEKRLADLKINNEIPPAISALIQSCLAKDPSQRPQDIASVADIIATAEFAKKPQQAPKGSAPEAKWDVVPSAAGPAVKKEESPSGKWSVVTAALVGGIIAALIVAGVVGYFITSIIKDGRNADPTVTSASPSGKEPAPPPATAPANTATPATTTQTSTAKSPEEMTKDELKAQRAIQEAAELAILASKSGSGFEDLFNGKDLTGWEGSPDYWQVQDGCITGQSKQDTEPFSRHFLVWKGGDVDNFELRFQFRFKLMKGNNRAIAQCIYRGKKVSNKGEIRGYQYMLTYNGDNIGLVGHRERSGLISFTQKTTVRATPDGNDKLEPVSDLEPQASLMKAYLKEEWNEAVLLVEGNRFIHKINGRVAGDLTDENKKRLTSSGVLAFELSMGDKPAVFMQIKDIKLRKLGGN